MYSIVTVNTPANSYDLTLLATVKTELGILTTAEDDSLATYIKQASGMCAAYTNRVLISEIITESFRSRSIDRMYQPKFEAIRLSRYPVTNISSIIEDTNVLVVNVDYEIDNDTGLLYRLNGDTVTPYQKLWQFRSLIINAAGGYVQATTLPLNIERAAINTVKLIRATANRDPTVKSESVPGVLATTYWANVGTEDGALPPDITALLDPYRNVSV